MSTHLHASTHVASHHRAPGSLHAAIEPCAAEEDQDAIDHAIDHAIEHLSHTLPAQGPIGTFVHHNTLHAYQHLRFHDAIAEVHHRTDARGYLDEARFREELASGRITDGDLRFALDKRRARVGERWSSPIAPSDIERLALVFDLRRRSIVEVRFAIEERAALERPEDAALFAVAERLAARWPVETKRRFERLGIDRTHRDALREATGVDPCEQADLWLVRFLAAYLDERVARWKMPSREQGLLTAAAQQLRVGRALRPTWQRRASEALDTTRHKGARAMIASSLASLGVRPAHWETYLERTVLPLAGWAGMIARLEAHPEDRGEDAPPTSLIEYVALRLTLDLELIADAANALGHQGPLSDLRTTLQARSRPEAASKSSLVAAFALFELAKAAGLDATALEQAGADGARSMLAILDAFDPLERGRVFQDAYERQHARMVLAALADNVRAPADPLDDHPRFQVIFCIDDREEAIRRHFEELDTRHETFGVAGFFGVAMEWASIDDPASAAHCPVVVTPAHVVRELATDSHSDVLRRRRARRALMARARRAMLDGTSTLARGLALTPVIGVIAAWSMLTRVLFPKWSAQVSRALDQALVPAPKTVLTTAHETHGEHGHQHPKQHGFREDERITRVKEMLESIGLVRSFAGLVVVLGHGASTVNNPHHSAYECGACGGHNGGPNARAFAAMANDRKVREGLRAVGIDIPESTWFIGGWHDTTTDAITLFDRDEVPAPLRDELAALTRALDEARARSAHERCRKFEHAPEKLTPARALAHVEERAVDLSQARPELGHATNAVAIIGRRSLTRGLFLDRRAFLVSYDPTLDHDDALLTRILGAVVPVGAGINLEYYFSTVDPERFGAGTKLPHNLAALLGVQEGVSGDLRTGLPRQMIEIHEPVRLLCVVEASPESLLAVAARKPEVLELVTNEWVRLVSLHPETHVMHLFEDGRFIRFDPEDIRLPIHRRSEERYHGTASSLPPAKITPRGARGTSREGTS